MTALSCPHPGELRTECDGRHCRACGALIYAASVIPQLPLVSPDPVARLLAAISVSDLNLTATANTTSPLDLRLVIARAWDELDAERRAPAKGSEDHARLLLALVLERAAHHVRASTETGPDS
ncbi:hypothetical protein E1265_21490 [Streptomyces sp. 8K308]|uniref:hypothetical protein n=1 Tax=Streptomyces sp. 8K308 TaxID=2530388 RepID=UPI001049A606|nr:hypothetical protein [Streptomyces sp. 8K308]TDC20602.1 hypothetical protein E1265_21490 [Streptomyces sp. 8K308]